MNVAEIDSTSSSTKYCLELLKRTEFNIRPELFDSDSLLEYLFHYTSLKKVAKSLQDQNDSTKTERNRFTSNT